MQLRLILYGLGQGLELIEKSIKSKHIIIGYMDSYARIKQYGGVFWSLESIKELEFDYIIITVIDRSVAWDIRNLLVNKYKIEEVPVSMNERTGGVSSIRLWKTVDYMVKVVLAIIIDSISFRRRGGKR